MIKTVAHPTVAEIFSINDSTVFRIPKYQREYTWGTGEWDAIFNDVTDNDLGYFLGSYICVDDGSKPNELELIDGQQRFTTIILLLTALYEKLYHLKDQMDFDELTDLVNLKSELAIKKQMYSSDGKKTTEYLQRLILQKQNSNEEDFSYLLSNKQIISAQVAKPNYFGLRKIAKAYRHFGKLIDEEVNEIKEEKPSASEVGILFGIVRRFEHAVLVKIEVDTNQDAYMLFESLNHRGVPLSALDLIKNTLISQAANEDDADNSYEIWKQILNNVGQDDYAVEERFFRQYYNAFREELNKPYESSDKKYYLGYLATRTTLLDIYEKMIKSDYKRLLNDLLDKSKVYSLITNNADETKLYSPALQDLERISGAPSYILLLYIISNQKEMGLSDDNINEIIHVLITFFVRRNVTDVPNTRKLTQLFIDTIADSKSSQGKEVVNIIQNKLKSVSAPDDLFESKLRGSIYDENPEATRFLLCSIEAQHQTKEIYSDLWSRDNSNKYVWTIEHIFPEGDNIPQAWVDMIADGDKELAKQYLLDYVHTLGNLTITGYNQNLSNMPFEQKRDRKSKDKTKYIGYRNGLFLNQSVVNEDKWTVDKIKDRTDMLVKILLDMYKW
ncbi:DUF262 domain-containing protein [Lactimicrobium massiliense]|uniref:DUF262 domain-containing protein n=1 Tax=Lactimicrobium massiliense TaxID=2161814 RepID=UPI000D55A3CF|nr:DUF262 domain-containing protein [Lactimicrobium massiliense]